MKITTPLIPIILCGGSGTRLWPLSRASYPKQFWALSDNSKKTLLQQTYLRLLGINQLAEPLLICNQEHRFIVAEQMREINITPSAILLEPKGRNTAPAITVAAIKAREISKDPLLLVLSADHIIQNEAKFREAIQKGLIYADQGKLVTFGVIPNKAETGYGYIEAEKELNSETLEGQNISRFVEKPNLDTAKKFLSNKRFSWNSGIFLFKASVILKELENLVPDVVNACNESIANNVSDLDFLRLEKNAFSRCQNIAIDKAVMEKTTLGTVLPLDAGWTDIGCWSTLWESSNKDKDGNVLKGNAIAKQSSNCYLHSESRLLVGLGIDNLIVVETDDAVLVAKKNESQNVKLLVKMLEQEGNLESTCHRKIYRPWGHYICVVKGNRWQVKTIEVKPGASLSLQMHHHRAEHWIVVKGTALIEKDEEKQLLGENESIYIPLGCKHRLTNPGKLPVKLIEVQSGSYLGEDDIIRLEDSYQRLN